MINKKQIIALLQEYKSSKQAKKFGIIKMGVFGSVARGSADKNSDINIVVELSKKNLLNRIGLKMSLENILGMSVDVVVQRNDLSSLLKNEPLIPMKMYRYTGQNVSLSRSSICNMYLYTDEQITICTDHLWLI